MSANQTFCTVPSDPLVQQAVEHMAGLQDFHAAAEYLSSLTRTTGAFERLDSLVFRCGDVMFNLALLFTMKSHAAGLRNAQPYGLAAAPKLIAFIEFTDKRSCLLVTQIEGVDRSLPIPCRGMNWNHVTQAGKQAFLADAEKQMASGCICTAFLSTQAWHVIPATGRLIIPNWSEYASVPSEAAAQAALARIRQEFTDRGM